jgi:hypothetical protein
MCIDVYWDVPREYDRKNPMVHVTFAALDISMCYNLIGYNALQFVLYS